MLSSGPRPITNLVPRPKFLIDFASAFNFFLRFTKHSKSKSSVEFLEAAPSPPQVYDWVLQLKYGDSEAVSRNRWICISQVVMAFIRLMKVELVWRVLVYFFLKKKKKKTWYFSLNKKFSDILYSNLVSPNKIPGYAPEDGLLTLRHVPVDRASTLCHGFPTKMGIFDNLISLIEFVLLVFYPC